MTRNPKITFVGPVQRVLWGPSASLVKPRHKGAQFTVLQDGGSLNLEYAKYGECVVARRQLCMNTHTYQVGSTQLLTAIHQALIEAKAGTPQGTVSDTPETEDHPYVDVDDTDAL